MKRSTKYSDPEKDEPDARHESERAKHYQYNPNFVSSKYNADALEYPCETFTSLRLSNINPRVSDEDVREAVYQSFKKFGEFNIKFAHTVDRRLVYVNFAFNEDAIVARNALTNRLELFDRLICIETVNHNRQWSKPTPYRSEYVHYRPNSPSHRVPNDSWDYQRRDVRLPDYYYQPRIAGEDSRHMVDVKHIPPEEDRRATRTLFVANVDDKMDPEVLKKYFDPYGIIEDIDIKCPTKGNGNPYAFVRYINLDMAYAAKVELSGQMLGRYQCKIGYARPVPTTCVWIGGLTDAVHKHDILNNFEKFGKIVAFKWPRGQKYAFVAYDSVDAAQLAIIEMRGFPLPGTVRGLRTDFVELKQLEIIQSHDKDGKKRHKRKASRSLSLSSSGGKRNTTKRKHKVSRGDESIYSSSSDEEKAFHKKRRDSSSSKSDSNVSNSSGESSLEKRKTAFQIGNVEAAETIVDLARCLPVLWSGLIELKNSTFYTHMHLVSGNGSLVDSLIVGLMSPNQSALKINQRLRLDKSRLKEVEKRITLSGNDGHCVLLAVSETSKDAKKHRPLTNLVSYLKQKNAAGVLSLSAKTKQNHETGLLHTFPPCEFAYSYLQKCAPKLTASFDENDYIVAILVKVN